MIFNTKRLISDPKIDQIEQMVARAYDTKVSELDVFYKDTDAKLMTCFLIYDVLGYNVKIIASWYSIYHRFLQNKIEEHYIKCLQDSGFMAKVTGFRIAVQNTNLQPAT